MDAAIGERVRCEGYGGDFATENQMQKKKMFEKVYPDLRTNDKGVACYRGSPFKAGTGTCVSSLINAQVS